MIGRSCLLPIFLRMAQTLVYSVFDSFPLSSGGQDKQVTFCVGNDYYSFTGLVLTNFLFLYCGSCELNVKTFLHFLCIYLKKENKK